MEENYEYLLFHRTPGCSGQLTPRSVCRSREAYHRAWCGSVCSWSIYLAAKTAAAKQRDDTAARISELEAALENMGADGSLRNGFVSTFGKYLDVKEITSEITAEVLKEVLVFPGDRFEIAWNYRDELEKLILDLQGEHQNGA